MDQRAIAQFHKTTMIQMLRFKLVRVSARGRLQACLRFKGSHLWWVAEIGVTTEPDLEKHSETSAEVLRAYSTQY